MPAQRSGPHAAQPLSPGSGLSCDARPVLGGLGRSKQVGVHAVVSGAPVCSGVTVSRAFPRTKPPGAGAGWQPLAPPPGADLRARHCPPSRQAGEEPRPPGRPHGDLGRHRPWSLAENSKLNNF